MRKKTLYFIFAYILLSVCSAHAQTEHEVQQTVIKLFDALSAKDATVLRNQCTANVRFLEYGEIWTIDTLITKAITKNTAVDFKRTNKLDFISTRIQDDVAWVTYNLYSEGTSNGKDFSVHWIESVVLVREKKKWKLDLLHSTRISKK